MNATAQRRILVVDDNPAIHADFQKVLAPAPDRALEALRAQLFGPDESSFAWPTYELCAVLRGEDALRQVRAHLRDDPYALAFVDMRMPQGWDGLRTVRELWCADPRLEVVICTAYADHPWEEIAKGLGVTDRLLIVKKPFDGIEIRQLAKTLMQKWDLARQVEAQMHDLEAEVAEKTRGLSDANTALAAKVAELEAAERRAREQAAALETANLSLESAIEVADAATRAKSEFLSNVTHELRTPITSILGFAELLAERGCPPEEAAQHCATIRRNGEHLLELINAVLDLSKIEAGAMKIERVPCSPCGIAQEVGELMRRRAQARGLDFEVRCGLTLPELVLCDPLRLRQILLNLVSNAIKFTERGFVRLEVRRGRAAGTIELEVADSGIGMRPDQVERLFQAFAQADGSTARRFGGTGLGLSISLKLAQLLGGEIRCASEPGHGTTFTVTLQAEPAAHVAPRPPDQSSTMVRKRVPPSALAGVRVLLAEDGRDNQRLMQVFLGRAGAEVESVDNGRQAVERALAARDAGRAHDLVLMDMQMPVVDGFEATAELRKLGFTVPVVALTANAFEGDRERCLAAGCSDYLTKPFKRVELVAFCREVLDRLAPR